jgi:uncharacterized protein
MNYQGITALITGASSGIGLEFTRELHKKGANVILVARRKELLDSISQELNNLRLNSAEYHCCNLADDTELNQLLDLLRSKEIHLLVNNAGRGSFGELHTLSLTEEVELLNTNVTAELKLVHTVITKQLELLKAVDNKNVGVIIVSSIAAFSPVPFMATYAASKAFNLIHGIALHFEYKENGIKVLTVCPGPVATQFGGVARVPGEMTNIKRDTPYAVVKDSLSAFEKGRCWVVVGGIGKLLGISRLLPYTLKTAITKKMLLNSLKQYTKK